MMLKMISKQQAPNQSQLLSQPQSQIQKPQQSQAQQQLQHQSSQSFMSSKPSNLLKPNRSANDLAPLLETSSNSIVVSSNNNASITANTSNLNENEYSPPWEHKQSILFQSMTASNTNSNNATTSQKQNDASNSTMSMLFNKLSLNRLSTRSNPSSSSSASSTRSSTSSLSTSSPPASTGVTGGGGGGGGGGGVPPAVPQLPPPPLPPPLLSTTNFEHKCMHRCAVHNQQQASPRLGQRGVLQPCMGGSGGGGVGIGPSCSSAFTVISGPNQNSNSSSLIVNSIMAAAAAAANSNGGNEGGGGCSSDSGGAGLVTHSSAASLFMNACKKNVATAVPNIYMSDNKSNKFFSWNSQCSANLNSLDAHGATTNFDGIFFYKKCKLLS
jgi:hypothetical protein